MRAQQCAYLSGLSHHKFTDPRVGDLLEIAELDGLSDDALSDEAVNLREWRHHYDRQTKVPAELVEELVHRSTLAVETWREARKQADFSMFKSDLAKLVELNIRQAEYIATKTHPTMPCSTPANRTAVDGDA
ncbi:MAG: carboxypeptidase M32 [Chloroflexi bacterium]|nr:carboxypeptidase M32 [Chloroflexota bacterium]